MCNSIILLSNLLCALVEIYGHHISFSLIQEITLVRRLVNVYYKREKIYKI